jgi:Flp pilus assembly secretin CpaC
METLENCKVIGILILLFAGLTACEKPGIAVTSGGKIAQTTDDAGSKVHEMIHKFCEKLTVQVDKTAVAIVDTEITLKVKAAVFAESGLKMLQIGVDTVRGIVILSGSVDTQLNSDRANALATAVAGVVKVDNRLFLKPSARSITNCNTLDRIRCWDGKNWKLE